MSPAESFLTRLDAEPWSALPRIALGLCIPPVFRVLTNGRDSVPIVLVMFIAVLLAVRIVPAVLRHVLSFSTEAKSIWNKRRQMAKRYDSYQWRKLFWIGVGLLPHAVAGTELRTSILVLTALCLIGGSAGLVVWRKAGAAAPGL